MVDVRRCIERFVEAYNKPGSPIFDFYADEIEWVSTLAGGALTERETPVGRVYGRKELFAALCEARGITVEMRERGQYVVEPPTPGSIIDTRLPIVRYINTAGDLGVLESTWAGTHIGMHGNPNTPMTGRMVWVLRFNAAGLITMDHHYWLWNELKFNTAADTPAG
jgi:hypothetical protein